MIHRALAFVVATLALTTLVAPAAEAPTYGWIGVRIQRVTDEIARMAGMTEKRGASVVGVDDKGPLNPVGVEPGDVIIKFDGHDIKEMPELPTVVADTPPGKDVEIVFVHRGAMQAKTVKVGRLDDVLAFNKRADGYRNKSDYDRAISDYSEAIRLDPKNANAYYNRGQSYGGKGNLDRAIADYDEAIRIDSKRDYMFFSRALSWRKKWDLDPTVMGYLDRAIADYGETIRLQPNSRGAFNNRGFAWESKGDLASAVADYTDSIRLDPKFVTPLGNRARVHEKLGNFYEALTDFRAALAIDPRLQASADGVKRMEQKLAAKSGYYLISGTDPDSAAYSGDALIERNGDVFKVIRAVAGTTFAGIGIESASFLSVSLRADAKFGLALYSKQGDGWAGVWTEGAGQQTGTEEWREPSGAVVSSPAAPSVDFSGQYVIFGSNPDHTTYTGEVTVERIGKTYQVTWTVAGERLTGTGIGHMNVLAVAYRAGNAVRLAIYTEEGEGRLGVWVKDGSQHMGAERWVRR